MPDAIIHTVYRTIFLLTGRASYTRVRMPITKAKSETPLITANKGLKIFLFFSVALFPGSSAAQAWRGSNRSDRTPLQVQAPKSLQAARPSGFSFPFFKCGGVFGCGENGRSARCGIACSVHGGTARGYARYLPAAHRYRPTKGEYNRKAPAN